MKKITFKKLNGFDAKNLMDWFNELNLDYDLNIKYENIIIDDMVNDFTIEFHSELEINISVYYGYVEIKCKVDGDKIVINEDDFYEVIFQ